MVEAEQRRTISGNVELDDAVPDNGDFEERPSGSITPDP
jgi:hypothetical protein